MSPALRGKLRKGLIITLLEAKILHIAPENTAGVPYNVMSMQNKFGMKARMLTLYKIPFNFPEDVCLNLPIPRSKAAMKWRDIKKAVMHKKIKNEKLDSFTYMPYFSPANRIEKAYMQRREKRNEGKFLKALKLLDAGSFDIYQFNGGIDFYSDSRLAKKWKSEGKKIINCYYGDDLRTRGVVREMDELSDLNLTFEYDHTLRHPDINFLFFPFDASQIKYADDKSFESAEKIRIIHAPTDRLVKGSELIISAVSLVRKSGFSVELVLAENVTRDEVINMKYSCHLAIDQIGNKGGTGYGLNSLETLAMGIPTITDMNAGMDSWLPENPFIVADSGNLARKIIDTLENFEEICKHRSRLRDWVIKYHSYDSVFKKMTEYYLKYNIVPGLGH